jgi:2-amino-4-hydroxy-6-hydroxymethyldihydropteridine diphosphokinase
MADGRWQMADGRWQMADGRWQMADGRWQMEMEMAGGRSEFQNPRANTNHGINGLNRREKTLLTTENADGRTTRKNEEGYSVSFAQSAVQPNLILRGQPTLNGKSSVFG